MPQENYDPNDNDEDDFSQEENQEEDRMRMETNTEFGQFLVNPQRSLKRSPFHRFVQKDMAVSYILHDDETQLIIMYQQLEDNLIHLAIDGEKVIKNKDGQIVKIPKFNAIIDVASIYDCEKLAHLEVWRSRKGFERQQLNTVTQNRNMNVRQQDNNGGWFKRNNGGQ